jgi:hypothetical protein
MFSTLTLNVHLRNPSIRLCTRTGFHEAGKGRGRSGVAMSRSLRDESSVRAASTIPLTPATVAAAFVAMRARRRKPLTLLVRTMLERLG